MNKALSLLLLVGLLCVGCRKNENEETYTKGSARIGVSDATFEVAAYVAHEYGRLYPQASVGVWRHPTHALLDSLVSERLDEVLLDRAVTREESLVFEQRGLKLFTYPVAHYPIYLLVAQDVKVEALDSVGLKRILEGTATNWTELGGGDVSITPYVPMDGEGAWLSLVSYYGQLDSVTAVICSTGAQMLAQSEGDPGALLLYGLKPAAALGFKKLRWAHDGQTIPANAKTIMESPRWPFMTTFTYATTHMKSDVAAGYLTFIVSNDGQKMVMKEGYRPASVPVRVIQLKSPPEGTGDSAEDTPE